MTTRRSVFVLACLLVGAPNATAASNGPRWTDVSPDGMIEAQKARALTANADALAAVATIAKLEARGAYGHAQKVLEEIGAAQHLAQDVREEALAVARAVAADAGSQAGVNAD